MVGGKWDSYFPLSEESERLHREESDLILIGGGIRRAQKKRSSLHSAHVGLGWFTQLFWRGMKINSVNLPYRLDLFLLWVINQTFFLKNHWLQISIVKVARLYFSLSYWPWSVAKKNLESGESSLTSPQVWERPSEEDLCLTLFHSSLFFFCSYPHREGYFHYQTDLGLTYF